MFSSDPVSPRACHKGVGSGSRPGTGANGGMARRRRGGVYEEVLLDPESDEDTGQAQASARSVSPKLQPKPMTRRLRVSGSKTPLPQLKATLPIGSQVPELRQSIALPAATASHPLEDQTQGRNRTEG